MQRASVLPILEAAYNLAGSRREAIRSIVEAATRLAPNGPIGVGYFDPPEQLDLQSIYFERADENYALRLLAWPKTIPIAIVQTMLWCTPRTINLRSEETKRLPTDIQIAARNVIPFSVLANTGTGGGLHMVFGHPTTGEWPLARMPHFQAMAEHLAAAWRLRAALTVTDRFPAIAAELRVDGTPTNLGPGASTPTARESLRRAVIAREQARTGRRSVTDQELWPALVAGRWSLLDTFSAAGTRYIVAYENPPGASELRALPPIERIVLEFALAGRSGKWIALELAVSEPTVARTLRTALRRIGVADLAALAGVRAALFEPFEDVDAGVTLAMARLTPAVLSLASLSQAERDIVAVILSGKRIAAIARERGTSPRTVAHQLASIYQKLGVSSRRELLAQLT